MRARDVERDLMMTLSRERADAAMPHEWWCRWAQRCYAWHVTRCREMLTSLCYDERYAMFKSYEDAAPPTFTPLFHATDVGLRRRHYCLLAASDAASDAMRCWRAMMLRDDARARAADDERAAQDAAAMPWWWRWKSRYDTRWWWWWYYDERWYER